ncbi:MAG: RdgB/HAM1 family non-canonical purine NTP pyrophosphatase [Chitinispirillia bacterium]
MTNTELIVATGNKGKMKEICEIGKSMPILFKSLRDIWSNVPDIPEDGLTFEENALIKASWVYTRKKVLTLADDSGLEIDILNGEPGVFSSRYSGIDCNHKRNIKKVLQKMDGIPLHRRSARFRCVMVLLGPHIDRKTVSGICEGTISNEPRGQNGFGYDSIFIPKGYDYTFAEMDQSLKNQISHRGIALRALKEELNEIFQEL